MRPTASLQNRGRSSLHSAADSTLRVLRPAFTATSSLISRGAAQRAQRPPLSTHGARPPPAAAASASGAARSLWSRRTSIVAMATASASSSDLLIVGPGVLGSYAGKLWGDAFPNATVVAQTNTTASHER